MLDWHLGMVETVDGRPRTLGAADACTLVRAWLVPVAADAPSSIVCALALATDGLDGALARAGEPTRLGPRDLERVVDAAFTAAALRGAVRQGWLAPSAATAEGARLVAGGAYAIAAYLGPATPPDPAIRRAARLAMPVRGAGLVAAGLGRRRTAGALVWTWAVVSAAAVGGVAGLKDSPLFCDAVRRFFAIFLVLFFVATGVAGARVSGREEVVAPRPQVGDRIRPAPTEGRSSRSRSAPSTTSGATRSAPRFPPPAASRR